MMLARALLLLVALTATASAQTPVRDLTSASLVGPFDQTIDHQTFIQAHAPGAFSPASQLPQVLVHWTFWSESCLHLADFETCLTKDDSIVIDVSDMGGIG